MPKITKRAVDALQPQDRDTYLWDDELTGFAVKVTPAGKKVFLIQYRIGGAKGRTRRVTLGHLGPVTPDEARTRAKELLAMTKLGKDPAEERDQKKAEPTFGQVIDDFVKLHVEPKTKGATAEEYKRLLRLYVGPTLRRRKFNSITENDIDKLHHDLGHPKKGEDGKTVPGRPYQANRLVAVLSKLFSWTERRGLRAAGANPCRHIQRFEEVGRERFLSQDELSRLGKALSEEERTYAVGAIRLLLFTGARLNEILSARWDWVDFSTGTIRLPDSKTGAKTLYLNAPALAVLEKLPRQDGNPYIIVGDKKGAHLVNLQKPWHAVRKAAGVSDVRLHDLRHTFASFAVAGKQSLPIVGKLLGHTQPQTTDRYSHLSSDPLRAASDAVAKRIAAAMSPPKGDNVRPFKKGTA